MQNLMSPATFERGTLLPPVGDESVAVHATSRST